MRPAPPRRAGRPGRQPRCSACCVGCRRVSGNCPAFLAVDPSSCTARRIGLAANGHAACDGCGSLYDNESTAPVDTFPPNRFGLYDMAGNTSSWTQGCYHGSYNGAPSDGSAWGDGSDCSAGRVVRVGSWNTGPLKLRSAYRAGYDNDRDGLVGFRLARTVD
jgi:hypothetical protein